MANFTTSPSMNLVIPTVGVDPGPDWASNINASLTIIDGHDHSAGKGVQITPSGINISSDLAVNGNNLTIARSIRFQPQTTPLAGASDIGVIYESGVDLYYNDANGNQIQITKNGSIAGTSGSIANLVSPASASYVGGSQTFVFESNANTPANIDGGSFIFRDLTANSFGVTVAPINSLASNYTLVLPTLPTQQNIMTLDQSGNMGAPWNVDNVTLQVSSNLIQVIPASITNTQIAPHTILDSNIANNTIQQDSLYIATASNTATAGNVAIDTITGGFNNTSYVSVGSVILTTTTRPVMIMLANAQSAAQLILNSTITAGGSAPFFIFADFQITGSNGFSAMTEFTYGTSNGGVGSALSVRSLVPIFIDTLGSSGAVTYTLSIRVGANAGGFNTPTVFLNNLMLLAKEL